MKNKICSLLLGLAATISPLKAMEQEDIANAQEIYDAFYPPVKVNELIYDVDSISGMLSVFDSRIQENIKNIDVGQYSKRPLAIGKFIYIPSLENRTLIIDTAQDHKVVNHLQKKTIWEPILNDNILYLFSENKIHMIDPGRNNEIIKEEEVVRIWVQPILHNNLLYYACNWRFHTWTNSIHIYEPGSLKENKLLKIPGYNFKVERLFSFNELLYAVVEPGYLIVIDPSRDYAMQEITLDHIANELFAYDGLLYLAAKFMGKVWVIDPRENHKIVREIEVDERPGRFIPLENLLYLSHTCSDTISVINPREHQVIKTLDIKRPSFAN